jgi:hypothetical protein
MQPPHDVHEAEALRRLLASQSVYPYSWLGLAAYAFVVALLALPLVDDGGTSPRWFWLRVACLAFFCLSAAWSLMSWRRGRRYLRMYPWALRPF